MTCNIKRILITGGTGFVGSALVKELALRGYELSVIVRQTSDLKKLREYLSDVRLFLYDNSIESISEVFKAAVPDVVIHLAAYFTAEHKESEIIPLVSSNILFGTLLLEVMKKNSVRFFITTGTHQQHNNGESYNPVGLYAATKQAFEMLARYYLETSDMRMVILKLVDTYGPYDSRPKIMSLLKRVSFSGEELKMSEGGQEIGLVYIDDVVKAYIRCLEVIDGMPEGESRSFIAAPKESYTLKEVVEIFERAIDKKLNIKWGERPYRKREMMKIWRGEANILENMETISLIEGIRKMIIIDNQQVIS